VSGPDAATTPPPASWAVIVRYAEIFLKGQNRRFFEDKLVRGLRRALADLPGSQVTRLHGRVLVVPGGGGSAQAAITRLQRVFGVASLSPARLAEKEEGALGDAAVEVAERALGTYSRTPSFRVRVQRADKRFPVASPELARRLGARVIERFKLPVDLEEAELVVGVEVGPERCFAFAESLPGPGGLPTGSAGPVTLLLSGGIDSPVAGWLAAKRGCEVSAVYFHSFPYTGDRTKEKVVGLARVLARWQGPSRLHVVDFTEVQKALRDAGPAELAVVLYRRMMVRAAELLGKRNGAKALVTGESLGQVASQTLENLAVIGRPATMPILRPLITFDKSETIALAQRIGTYDLSVQPYEDCCSLFVPRHPATKARLFDVEKAESKLDVAALALKLADTVETVAIEPAA
jgi:thiamine biosynthesis protein ThiI